MHAYSHMHTYIAIYANIPYVCVYIANYIAK